MTDSEFLVRVQLEGGTGVEGTEASATSVAKDSKGKVKKKPATQVANAVKGVLQGLGIASALSVIVGIVSSFRPLITIVGNILKLITLVLSPIADVLLVLLMPILLIIKPIAIAINQVMLPFVKQGLTFMQEGIAEGDPAKIAAGTATIFAGLQAVIVFLSSQIIEFALVSLLTIAATIVGLFSEEAGRAITDEIIPSVSTLVDSMAALAIAGISANVISLGNEVGSDMSSFTENIVNMIGTVFGGVSEDTLLGISDALNTVNDEGLIPGFADLGTVALDVWGTFGLDMGMAIAGAFTAIIAAFEEEVSLQLSGFFEGGKERITQFLTNTAVGATGFLLGGGSTALGSLAVKWITYEDNAGQ